ncbi:MAG: DegT/DnrJ/EryC1/StrS family aminotransferase [Rhodospirillaceae bacterium]|nr:DegT/DnrJ/EryC1/StrS family aminotransferase [Rhodospirillaceae bacterium]
MTARTLQISKPHFSPEQRRKILAGIAEILESGRVMLGPFAATLERDFAARIGTAHAVSVNSCTTALQICLDYWGARGGEVLIPAAAFTTDVSVARWGGATPVLVDIDPTTLSFDLEDLERKVSPRTRAIIWVHLTGLIAPSYRAIVDLAARLDLFLIEDCAHALGAAIDARCAGSIAAAGCHSFFATKLITSGAGGMITTNDPGLDRFAREMRLFGRSLDSGFVVREGNDWFLDEFRACVAAAQLGDLDSMLARRRELAVHYGSALANQPGISLLDVPDNAQHAYYQFPVFLAPPLDAAAIGRALKERHGIEAKRIYLPVHQEAIFRKYDNGTLKQSENALHRSLCLPMHPELSAGDVERVSSALVAEVRERL